MSDTLTENNLPSIVHSIAAPGKHLSNAIRVLHLEHLSLLTRLRTKYGVHSAPYFSPQSVCTSCTEGVVKIRVTGHRLLLLALTLP
jgi:hypothetical protein